MGALVRSSLIVFAVGLLGLPAVATDTPEAKALAAAEAWLAAVDAGNYDQSWLAAAGYFRNAIGQDQWRQTIGAVRGPLGDVRARELASRTYRTELPGAPDGQYVVIQFHTAFANKQAAVETITPMMDDDGNWRVAGYFIR